MVGGVLLFFMMKMTMFAYEVVTADETNLEAVLNHAVKQGKEVFQILPTINFKTTQVMMVKVPLPDQVQYKVVLKTNTET